MSTIITRSGKGAPLTNNEVDANFTNLNADKYQAGDSPSFVNVSLDGMTAPIVWNADEGALNIPLNSSVTLQTGQEFVVYAKATTAIANGDVAVFAGAQGGHILIAKCDLNAVGFDPTHVVGIATQNFAVNEFGYVTSTGKVNEVDTSAYAEGTILYASSTIAGGLTPVAPTSPLHAVQVAVVVRQHAIQGAILVRVTDIKALGEIAGVNIANASSGQFLTYNGASWVNSTQNVLDWDTAYGWGNHASAGYVVGNTSNAANLTITGVMQANNGYKVGTVTVIDSNRNLTNIGTLNGGTAWHSGNDGIDSGLNADLLDGYDSNDFIKTYDTIDSGNF